tara:strand:- start:471 stop:1334 length:864 start_codon:yes stop_codon:yes gene_type:complete
MLNEDGGIETDLTVICMDKNYYRIISSAANRERDKFHILKHLSSNISLYDVTEKLCCFGVFGPNSRDLILKLSKDDFSNENFTFGTGKYVKIDGINVWAQRLSYVGELGYELYVETNQAIKLYNSIVKEGKKYGISHCGMHAMDTMRMESGYLHWGHDISPEENQYEASLGFAVSFKKNIDFIGKDALIKIKEKKIKKKLTMLTLEDSIPGKPLLLHDEPIYFDNNIVGRTTSGNFSFCFNKNLSFGYIQTNKLKELKDEKVYIEVEKKKYLAKILDKPLNQKNFKI